MRGCVSSSLRNFLFIKITAKYVFFFISSKEEIPDEGMRGEKSKKSKRKNHHVAKVKFIFLCKSSINTIKRCRTDAVYRDFRAFRLIWIYPYRKFVYKKKNNGLMSMLYDVGRRNDARARTEKTKNEENTLLKKTIDGW